MVAVDDLPISEREEIARELRAFLSEKEARRRWTCKKLALEIWHLTAVLRRQFGNWENFWEVRKRRIEHIRAGRYATLTDDALYAGFRLFLQKHAHAVTSAEHLTPLALHEIARVLRSFLDGDASPTTADISRRKAERDEEQHFPEPRVVEVVEIRSVYPATPDGWQHSYLAFRPLADDPSVYAIVWFTLKSAAINDQGFMLASRGVLVLRAVLDPNRHILGSLAEPPNESFQRPVVTGNFLIGGGYQFPYTPLLHQCFLAGIENAEIGGMATNLLNFVDKRS